MTDSKIFTYVASSEVGHDTGVYVYELDPTTGALNAVEQVKTVKSCQYIAFDPTQRFIYVTGAKGADAEADPGMVSAFSLDNATGKITYLNEQPTNGVAPCYVTVDGTGKYVLVVNYAGPGSAFVFPIGADGQLGERTDIVQNEGHSVNTERQEDSHPHMVTTDLSTGLVFIPDLGTDKIMLYHLDKEAGKLTPHEPPFVEINPGSGPRHIDFAHGRVYLATELANTLNVFDYDSAVGTLDERQILSTLPGDFSEVSYAADIHVLPDGRFVYVSNRGHNSIAIFGVDAKTGEVSSQGFESVLGDWPRSFTIDPTGRILLVANQRSHNVVTFWIDPVTGELTPTGQSVQVPAPICVKTIIARP